MSGPTALSTELSAFRWRNSIKIEDASLISVVLFTAVWLCIGNLWSVAASHWVLDFPEAIVILSAVIYFAAAVPVVICFFAELFSLRSILKWLVALEVIMFSVFIIPPPRNADAMRVWLAKPYDVWMHGTKIFRPYFHYNTPDAFTLFHLPLINLWDGQVFQCSIWIAMCATLILLIRIGRIYTSDKVIALVLCLFIFNPLIILASTVVISDIPLILAVTGLIYAIILYEQGRFGKSMFLVCLFVAFGMNIKYNMLMFLPVVLYWSIKKISVDGINWKAAPLVIAFAGLAVLPYYMNYMNIGNPVWPALTNVFPARNPSWDKVAFLGSESFLGGSRSIRNFIQSFCRLFLMPHHINPLAVFTIFFVFRRYKYLDFIPALLAVTYFFCLWLMMPQFAVSEKERYVLYSFPVIIPFGMIGINDMNCLSGFRGRLPKLFEIFVIASLIAYLLFTAVYSKDVFKYLVERDKNVWHEDTWYYKDYEWINKNITLDKYGQILVVVSNQETYYLRKPYVNGDTSSALIDWRALTGLNSILVELHKYNVRYIFIDADYVNGNQYLKRAFDIMIKNKAIEVMRESKVRLTNSRLRRLYSETLTILYKVKI